ncbi:sulfatase-like hydrolase/transferase [Vallitalea okinawensis]|uniref:sulfatase-like hydrolase/transferase n=1 Tax=Vallitalea okinawensis TaxID=2078660 RepID=UPI000CFD1D50|nr:sulfatase-like hydrolase/transferase [Vallitalea okinawensis]
MTNNPNVLFFFTDDQRFDTIQALGNEEIHTPNLDELVKSGTTFTHAHIPGGTVGAVCMPSRAMLHTGRTLFNLENNGSTIPENHSIFGETLRENGYETFGTGKWHNGKSTFNRSFNHGAEIFFGGMNDHWNVPAYHYDPTGKYASRKFINNWLYNNKVDHHDCDHISAGKHSSELFSECSIKWLQEYDSDNPFYMYISFMAPHDPRSMPDEFLNMYDPESITLPNNFMEEHRFDFGITEIRDELLTPYPRRKSEIKRHIAEYYGMISHLDNELGKVISVLKEKDLYDNTIIVFAGDNGLALGQHGLMGKQSCYEHSIRVPLIFSGPSIPVNKQCNSYAYLLDIFPTICDLLEIEAPDSVEGCSLLPAIQHDNKIRDYLYFGYGDCCRAIKNDRFKLIEYRTEELKETQLFDLINDPLEKINLSEDSTFHYIYSELTGKLLEFSKEWNDTKHPIGKDFWDKY